MFAIDVEFKNGNILNGLVWTWHPEKGTFEALDESTGKVKKYKFKDVKSGKFYNDHIRQTALVEDFLTKARDDGLDL